MEILINGQKADITLENEKTIGEIMSAFEQWLRDSGHRLSGLVIDGETVTSSSLEDSFLKEIKDIKTLDILTNSIAELGALSLLNLISDIEEFDNLTFNEKTNFYDSWKESPEAQFIKDQIPDIFNLFCGTFTNTGYNTQTLLSITEERLREVNDPANELEKTGSIVSQTCTLLIDLPLDIQTGKDAKAAETIQIFTGVSEKIIRLFNQLSIQGLIKEKDTVYALLNDFNNSVRELLQAYETKDTVLIGDLAEYEMAPRLQELYNCITTSIIESAGSK